VHEESFQSQAREKGGTDLRGCCKFQFFSSALLQNIPATFSCPLLQIPQVLFLSQQWFQITAFLDHFCCKF
jgi:hypothetical protein